jgi:hypothetical protein
MTGNREAVTAFLVDARVALTRLDDDGAMQGVDDYHDAMRAVTHAANCMGITVQEFDALAKAQREVEG